MFETRPLSKRLFRSIKLTGIVSYCVLSSTLFLGPIEVRAEAPGTIITIAGNGDGPLQCPSNCNPSFVPGSPATTYNFYHLEDMAVDRRGNIFVADLTDGNLKKIDPSYRMTFAAGHHAPDFRLTEGLPAEKVKGHFHSMAFDAQGNLYYADPVHHRVRKIGVDGIVNTIAGSSEPVNDDYIGGFSGDNGPATQARMDLPSQVALDPQGNLYIGDWNNLRIRKVDLQGTITTFISGPSYLSRDVKIGMNIRNAVHLRSFTIDRDGNLVGVITHEVLVVSPEGILLKRYGRDQIVHSVEWDASLEEGVDARDALLREIQDVAVDSLGNIFLADRHFFRVRKIDPQGIITTVAGMGYHHIYDETQSNTPVGADTGDGGPATEAYLNRPRGVEIDAEGNLLIAMSTGRKIRKVFGVAGRGLIAGQPIPSSGDVTRDSKVDLNDALLTLAAALEMTQLSQEQKFFADMNCNGRIEIDDAVAVLQRAVGL